VEDLSSYFPVTRLAHSKEMRRKDKDASYPDFMESPLSPRRQRANTVTTRVELMTQVHSPLQHQALTFMLTFSCARVCRFR
jgi:hypothetical protein